MRYLFIAFLFVSLFGHSQGIEPSSFQGNPNKSGFLKSVTLNVDDFGDTTYLYVHVDSLGIADSIYLRGDSLILLKNGSGQVYKNRIYTGLFSAYDVPNPQKYDIYVNADQTSYWWDGTDWVLFDGDTNPYNEGELTLHDMDTNVVGMRSNTNYFNVKNFVGLNGIQISTNELDTINIGIDTTLFEAGETQYLNPYVVTGDTTGFYLTVAQDTVLFLSTIDSTGVADSTSVVGVYGIDVVESPANVWTVGADTSQLATPYDLTLKENVLSFTSPLSRSGNTISIPAASTSVSGHLTSTDWNTFNAKVSGSGTATRLAFWIGTSALSSSANAYWDNTNSRLGIGTASPLMKLDVSGDVSITGGSALYSFGTGNAGSTDARWGNFYNSGSETRFLTSGKGTYSSAVPDMYFSKFNGSNVTDMMFIKSSNGNVGIGTITPNTNLELKGSSFTGGLPTDNSFTTGSALTLNNNTGSGTIASINYSTIPTFELVPDVTKPANGLRMGTFNVLGTGDMFFQLAATSSTGYSYFEAFGGEGLVLGTGEAKPIHFRPNRNTAMTILSGGNVGIGNISPQRKLHVTGEVRITDLTTDTPTKIVGADADGDLAAITKGYGLSFATDTLKADTTSANGLATQYDLTQISGSSKAIDRLASDFATTATSLQTTNIDYTFPSTGLYHVVLIANFQTTNTNGGIKAAYAASGGLTYDFISGAHRAPIDIYDATTERVSSLETLTSGINTTGVNPSGTPHHLQSDMLINVTTAGTVTLTFASESGSYTATLKAGSTLIIEKLN